MRVFITGATGFVGRNFLEYLLKHQPGLEITCLTRDPQKAAAMAQAPHLRWVAGDLLQPETYRNAVQQADYIFHLAALVKLRNGPEFYAANTESTRLLLEAAKSAFSLKRLVFSGSIAAIDRPWTPDGHIAAAGPLTETSPPHPNTDYGKSKGQAEALIRESGLPYAVAIPAYIYGPYPRPNSSMDRFLRDSQAKLPYTRIPFPGRASEIYAEDLAEILWLLAKHPAALNETFFTANPDPVAVGQAFQTVCEMLGLPYEPRTTSPEVLRRLREFAYRQSPTDPLRRILFEDYFYCSAEKLFRLTGYHPRYGFREGVARTVHWYRAQGLL